MSLLSGARHCNIIHTFKCLASWRDLQTAAMQQEQFRQVRLGRMNKIHHMYVHEHFAPGLHQYKSEYIFICTRSTCRAVYCTSGLSSWNTARR